MSLHHVQDTPASLTLTNEPSPDTSYFTPKHLYSPGATLPQSDTGKAVKIPRLFQPLTIRNVTLRNRILVAPMCQYSAASSGPFTGSLTDYHIATLGHYALKGAALVFIEATAVQARGRISPNDSGLWCDSQIAGVRRVAEFVKSQGSIVGLQLAHAGRKASVLPPWVTSARRTAGGFKPGSWIAKATADGGWDNDVHGPMGGEQETWDGLVPGKDPASGFCVPQEMSLADIDELVRDWGMAAKRAVEAGVQVIEVHAAHGYLLHSFLSPVTNKRADIYGGCWEGRVRILKDVVLEVRKTIPTDMPLFLRVSATEWLEGTEVESKNHGSWTVEDTIRLAALLPDWGVDLLDISSGGNHPAQQVDPWAAKDYQTRIASRVRAEMKTRGKSLLIGAVGLITAAEQARDILEPNYSTISETASGVEEGMTIEKELTQQVDCAVATSERIKENGIAHGEPMADLILVGRQFLREPHWVLKVAWQLGVDVAWPNQFMRFRYRS